MGKKIEDAEVKKECPSCGLGVSLDSTICEFCGWDFEEEDEWILQIEKLERELMLEKQRFEPGSVNHKIESTLHTPNVERAKSATAPPAEPSPAQPAPARVEPTPRPAQKVVAKPQRTVAPAPVKPVAAPRPVEQPRPAPRPTQPAPTPAPEKSPPPSDGAGKTRKVRVVRKVKQ